jgi:hypothetical protein
MQMLNSRSQVGGPVAQWPSDPFRSKMLRHVQILFSPYEANILTFTTYSVYSVTTARLQSDMMHRLSYFHPVRSSCAYSKVNPCDQGSLSSQRPMVQLPTEPPAHPGVLLQRRCR